MEEVGVLRQEISRQASGRGQRYSQELRGQVVRWAKCSRLIEVVVHKLRFSNEEGPG